MALKNKYRIYKVGFCVLLIFIGLITVSKVYAVSIEDVLYLEPYLETDAVLTDLLRGLGQWLAELESGILTYCENGLKSLLKWDIMQLESVKTTLKNLQAVFDYMVGIALVGVILVKMAKLENTLKVIYNLFMTAMIVSIFGIVLSIMTGVKNSALTESEFITKSGDIPLADKIYMDNSIDILRSIQEEKIVYLSDIENLDLSRVDTGLRIKRDVLNEYRTYDEWGLEDVGTLTDGVWGHGDERYYRFHIDYVAINCILGVMIIIFILGIFKGGYLVWQWLSVNMFGRVGLLKGLWDTDLIWGTFKSALKTLSGMVILYFSMLLFGTIASSIVQSSDLDNFLVKSVAIFSIGMGIVVGSGYVNEFLGIDDGSNHALKSIFMATRLGRIGKGAIGAPKHALHKVANSKAGRYVRNGVSTRARDMKDIMNRSTHIGKDRNYDNSLRDKSSNHTQTHDNPYPNSTRTFDVTHGGQREHEGGMNTFSSNGNSRSFNSHGERDQQNNVNTMKRNYDENKGSAYNNSHNKYAHVSPEIDRSNLGGNQYKKDIGRSIHDKEVTRSGNTRDLKTKRYDDAMSHDVFDLDNKKVMKNSSPDISQTLGALSKVKNKSYKKK